MEISRGNSICLDCHKEECVCELIENIYLVEYKLVIDTGIFPTWCQEKVRVITHDAWVARMIVNNWLKTTETIWYNAKEGPIEHDIPDGGRDISIVSVEIYAQDVGGLLKQCPIPTILPHEV